MHSAEIDLGHFRNHWNFFFLETESHYVTLTDQELSMQYKLTLNTTKHSLLNIFFMKLITNSNGNF